MIMKKAGEHGGDDKTNCNSSLGLVNKGLIQGL